MRLRFALGAWSNRHFDLGLYPLGTRHEEHLPRYATIFDAVEVDRLYHDQLDIARLETWRSQVPPAFDFLPKLHRSVVASGGVESFTSRGRVRVGALHLDAHAAEEAFARLTPLSPRFVLAQLPPSLERTGQDVRELEAILSASPFPIAVEFRHASWFTADVRRLLDDHDTCLVHSTYPGVEPPGWHTSSFGYVRFTGKAHKSARTRGRALATKDRLEDVLTVRHHVAAAPYEEVFVVVTNPFEGNAIDSLPRIAAALGDLAFAKRVTRGPGAVLFPDGSKKS